VIRGSLLLAVLLVVLVVLSAGEVAISGTAVPGPPAYRGGPPSGHLTSLQSHDPADRSAFLTALNLTIPAGVPNLFWLNFTGVNCSAGAPPAETVTGVTFEMGDGFVFQLGGNSSGECASPFSEGSIPLLYAYRSAGPENVSAFVTWGNGAATDSNRLTLNVTSPSWADLPAFGTWVWVFGAGAGATLGTCLVLRRMLATRPPPPVV
jgi:hypothetical protein